MSGTSPVALDRVVTTSLFLARMPHLKLLINANSVAWCPSWLSFLPIGQRSVLAWGRKPSSIDAERLARRHKLPLVRIEDGFLRSFGLGSVCPPTSVVIDDVGIYYDAGQPSRLEALIKESLTPQQSQQSQHLTELWRRCGVSKYNHNKHFSDTNDTPKVLVVDQTAGDASIEYGQGNAKSFRRMLEAALDVYPKHRVLLKVHPDVFAGKKLGHFSTLSRSLQQRVDVLKEDFHPASLIASSDAIFCVTSQMGFEGLIHGKKVYTFGMPFFAGWGVTHDDLQAPERRHHVPLEQLIYAALVKYPRYIDPQEAKLSDLESNINWFGHLRAKLVMGLS